MRPTTGRVKRMALSMRGVSLRRMEDAQSGAGAVLKLRESGRIAQLRRARIKKIRADTVDHAAGTTAEHQHFVGQVNGLRNAVGDEHDSRAVEAADVEQQVLHF